MQLFETEIEFTQHLEGLRADNLKIGMVPTMGALHEGHLTLVKRAALENDRVVVSIFVNPTQFNNEEDLRKYPTDHDRDIGLLKGISEKIDLFRPLTAEVYPYGIQAGQYELGALETRMEGAFRPGHFQGVATVVERLLRIAKPDRAYFGEKDYQQLLIIRRLAQIKGLDVEIIGCPIVREANGLAMSSRNERLSKRLREKSGLIYRSLRSAKELFGTKSALEVKEWVREKYEVVPELDLEYFEIADATTLEPVVKNNYSDKCRAFIAVYANGIRLIDNIALN